MKTIELTQGQVTIVDDEDYDYLMQWKWYAITDIYTQISYAVRKQRKGEYITLSDRRHVYMHRVILNAPDNVVADHINGSTLDNRRANLRIASLAENARNRKKQINNTSGYKGVSWNKQRRKWAGHIKVNGKSIYLGLFLTPEEAHEAYKAAAEKYHGEFARYV